MRGGKRGLGNREANHYRTEMPVHEHKQKEKCDKKRKLKPLNLKKKRKKERNGETGKGQGTVRKKTKKQDRNGPPARHSVASRSQIDATAHLHGDLGKCVILTSRGPVTSFLPITLYEVFITALSGAVD